MATADKLWIPSSKILILTGCSTVMIMCSLYILKIVVILQMGTCHREIRHSEAEKKNWINSEKVNATPKVEFELGLLISISAQLHCLSSP